MSEKKSIHFRSPVARYITSFLRERCITGIKDGKREMFYTLGQLDGYLVDIKQSTAHITKGIWEGWLSSFGDLKESSLYRKYRIAIRFATYLCTMGVDSYIPRAPKLCFNDFVPHIFSHEEMADIFSACDRLQLDKNYPGSILVSMPALLRLLYSTGIRIGEALSIRNRDVDFGCHAIRLNKTKNGRQRLAPINMSMEIVLKEYIGYRDRIRRESIALPDSPLFATSAGNLFTQASVRRWFRVIMDNAGIVYTGNFSGYRVHSLRHTACVHSMMKLADEGLDLYANLPVLSVFMGHVKIVDTERYLRLTQEMYSSIVNADTNITTEILGILSDSMKPGYEGK
jgi:site-specific recombinase XerD